MFILWCHDRKCLHLLSEQNVGCTVLAEKSIEQDYRNRALVNLMMESLEKGLMNSGSIDGDLVDFDIDRKL